MARVVAENLETYDCNASPTISGIFDDIYWCLHCQIPLLTDHCSICDSDAKTCAKDLKPVFAEERRLFETITSTILPSFLFANRNHIYFDGQTLFAFKADAHIGLHLTTNKINRLTTYPQSIYQDAYAEEKWKLCLRANQEALEHIEAEALEFITRESNRFPNRAKVVSFSGGKDSAVTAILVQKALGSIPLVFGDTTIEFPDTYSYIERFAEANGFELHQEKPDADFLDLCKTLGPPSRIMRWCCTVCKSRPINKFYNQLERDVVSFDGIRRMESSRRANYPRVVQVQKFSRQVAARPIVNWSSFAVWLYILYKQVEYNPLYENGYNRVGCLYCPSNSPYNEYLTKLNFPELYTKWFDYLIEYATQCNKKDPTSYVMDGCWKTRNISKQRDFVVEPSKPCIQRDEITYSFDIPITSELVEFLKPFGRLTTFTSRAEQANFVIGRGNPLFISGVVGDTQLAISLGGKNPYLLRMQIEKQIEKYLNCVHCGGCAGVCLKGAISIMNGGYHIDNNKCAKCGRCVTTKYLKEGCVALNFNAMKKAIRRQSSGD